MLVTVQFRSRVRVKKEAVLKAAFLFSFGKDNFKIFKWIPGLTGKTEILAGVEVSLIVAAWPEFNSSAWNIRSAGFIKKPTAVYSY